MLVGFPKELSAIAKAVEQETDVTEHLDALAAGEWQVLGRAVSSAAPV